MTILAFVVLAWGTAFAAGQLGKNSVGPKQLKKNAVTSAKIKNSAVTAAKIKDGAISGSKLDLAKLGTVPSATTATSAGNANTVNGRTIGKVFAKIPKGASATIATFGSFAIRAECEAVTGNVEFFQVVSSGQISDLVGGSIGDEGQSFDQESGPTPSLELDNGEGVNNNRGVASFSASHADGTTISGVVGFDDTKTFSTEEVCAFYGHVTS